MKTETKSRKLWSTRIKHKPFLQALRGRGAEKPACVGVHKGDAVPAFNRGGGDDEMQIEIKSWINEDELNEENMYEILFPLSRVDFVRMFPKEIVVKAKMLPSAEGR
jgi:hypothetical protein